MGRVLPTYFISVLKTNWIKIKEKLRKLAKLLQQPSQSVSAQCLERIHTELSGSGLYSTLVRLSPASVRLIRGHCVTKMLMDERKVLYLFVV